MLLFLMCLGLLLSNNCQGQFYHYQRPHRPFQAYRPPPPPPPPQQQITLAYRATQPQQQQQHGSPQPAKFIVHTLGPRSRAYEVQVHKSETSYVAHQTGGLQGNQLAYNAAKPAAVATLYQAPQVQPTTSYTNPLLANANAQALTAAPAAAPAAPPAAAPAAAGYFYPTPQAASGAAAALVNAQPYAVVRLPNGQQVQDAGHGAGPEQASSSQSFAVAPRPGDYIAQSQSSQLDGYAYKQSVPGDPRAYQRYVTVCQPHGPCQRVALAPGQVDAGHQQLVQAARAQTLPAADACKQKAAAKAAATASYHRGGAAAAIAAAYQPTSTPETVRPRDRRYFAYRETQVSRDPYN